MSLYNNVLDYLFQSYTSKKQALKNISAEPYNILSTPHRTLTPPF